MVGYTVKLWCGLGLEDEAFDFEEMIEQEIEDGEIESWEEFWDTWN